MGILSLGGVAAFSPHDFCCTFLDRNITNLLGSGADVLTVPKLAGHAAPSTTQKYDLRDESAERHPVQLLHVHYEK